MMTTKHKPSRNGDNQNRMHSFWIILPILIFGGLIAILSLNIGKDSSLLPAAKLNQKVPAFRLADLMQQDLTRTEQDIKGQPMLLNIWATWCSSCWVEHPALLWLSEQGISIVGLNYKDDKAAALNYLQRQGNPFSFNIVDSKGQLGLDLGVYGAPETYFVDKNGVIRYRHVGVITKDLWLQKLASIWQQLLGDES